MFAVEYALAQLWQAWGLRPDAVMGHSIGELVAACIAGVMPLEEALQLVAQRGKLMQGLPKQGAMAVVLAAEAAVRDVLVPHHGRVVIAAVNSPQNTVISGEQQAVAQILKTLNERHVPSKTLTVSHAFHSPLMEPILDAFEATAARIAYQAPNLPLISNRTGAWLDTAPDARYWRDHVRHTVRFADGMQTLYEQGYEVFVEIGPGNALLGMGRQCLPEANATWLASLSRQQQDWQTLLQSVQTLYLEGFPINWTQLEQGFPRRRMSLPTYPFQRQRYWLEAPPSSDAHALRRASSDAHPLLGTRLRAGLPDIQFEALYRLDALPYLQDHRIYGMMVLPTTAGIETALAAGHACFGNTDVALENLIYHEAMVLPEDEARLVHTILTPQGARTTAFQLLSTAMSGEDDWRRHMSGVLRLGAARVTPEDGASPVFSVAEVQAHCPSAIPAERYYPAIRTMGLDYGPSFQGIQQLRRGDGEALSAVRLPPHVSGAGYGLHPAFLDACLHIYPALAEASGDFSQLCSHHGPTYLPIGIERFRVYQAHTTTAWVHAIRRHHHAETETLVLDLRLYDEASNPVAAFDGLSVRQLPPEALRPAAAGTAPAMDWLYHMRWDEQPPSEPAHGAVSGEPSSWLLFADADGVAEAVRPCCNSATITATWCWRTALSPRMPPHAGASIPPKWTIFTGSCTTCIRRNPSPAGV